MLEKKIYRLTEVIRWKYIQILSFQCKQMSQNVTKKTTGNIGYILTEFEEKNATEVAQLMQQMLLYCKVLF